MLTRFFDKQYHNNAKALNLTKWFQQHIYFQPEIHTKPVCSAHTQNEDINNYYM